MRVCVICAGVAGLVSAKVLKAEYLAPLWAERYRGLAEERKRVVAL